MALKRRLITVFLASFILFAAADSHAFFGAKFEPPDGMIYHGAQAEVRPESVLKPSVDWTGIEEYAKASGKHPKLIMHYISFDEHAFTLLKSAIYEISQKEYAYVPQIGLDFYSYNNNQGIMNPNDITQEITQGKHDEKIKELASLLTKMETSVFLRPGYEFGGNGQGSRASKAYWTQAWRRIYDIFQKKKAFNVTFVWNTLDAKDFMDYYPGDAYVDWWAINVFVNNADQDSFINSFIRQAAEHKKPVMIAESTPRYIGSIGGETAWNKWYQPYFSLIAKYPHIKALCYINASWKGYPDPTFAYDCRIQSNPVVASRYREAMSSPSIIHAVEK